MRKITKTWLGLLLIAASLFIIVGLALLFIDKAYLYSLQYLSTASLYVYAFYAIKKKKVKFHPRDPKFSLGFIFSVIGLSNPLGQGFQISLWVFGLILFVYSLSGRRLVK